MHNKGVWLGIVVLFALAMIFFNLKYLGLATVNTTSNVTVIPPDFTPYFGFVNTTFYACEDSIFYSEFYAYDQDGNALTGDISPRNPFFIFWVSQSNPNNNTFAIVSGILTKNTAGGVNAGSKLYKETISIDDGFNSTCCSNTTKTNITVIEMNHAPSIDDVGVKTIWTSGENSNFYEVVNASDEEYGLGYGNLTFNVTITNASSGSHVNLFNISSSGGHGTINFTGNSSTPIGVYNITVCVNDSGLTNAYQYINQICNQTGGTLNACDNFSLTVTNSNRAPNITSYYPSNLSLSVYDTSILPFNITTNDPDGTIPDAYWYADGVFKEHDSGSSLGEFSYNFGCGVSGNHNVTVSATDGLLSQNITWNISLSEVSCFVSPVQVGGGGGGGAAVSSVNFNVTPEFLTASILKEDGRSFDIKVKNIGTTKANITTEIQNLSEKAILNEDNFVLNGGEEKTVRLYLYALKSAKPGVYFGKIVFRSGGIERKVSVVLEIKERESLFDIKVSIPPRYKSVYPGQDVKAIVDLLNVGLYGSDVDVELYLSINNFDKFIINQTSKEIIAVKTNVSIERTLNVPFGTPKGPYIVLGEARYGNITVTTYDTFNVVEKSYLRASYVIIILLILLFIFFILFILWKRRKKKKAEET